ncbi:Uncharacterised protein [Klebsiella quasipneumoniae]|nr:Uncharacterised protein [Klebsiella quasipneumoniae]
MVVYLMVLTSQMRRSVPYVYLSHLKITRKALCHLS